jgi:hypothetical protein
MRNDLVNSITAPGRQALVEGAMRQNRPLVEAPEPLRATFHEIRQGECSTLPILLDGGLEELLVIESVWEPVVISEATRQSEAGT